MFLCLTRFAVLWHGFLEMQFVSLAFALMYQGRNIGCKSLWRRRRSGAKKQSGNSSAWSGECGNSSAFEAAGDCVCDRVITKVLELSMRYKSVCVSIAGARARAQGCLQNRASVTLFSLSLSRHQKKSNVSRCFVICLDDLQLLLLLRVVWVGGRLERRLVFGARAVGVWRVCMRRAAAARRRRHDQTHTHQTDSPGAPAP